MRAARAAGFTEIHCVNGENPHVDLEYYVDLSGAERGAAGRPPQVLYGVRDPPHVEARGLTHEEVLRELKDAGLGSMPGGGAEVFADRVRRSSRRARSIRTTGSTSRHGAPARHPDAVHDAVRPRRDLRGARRPPAPAARAAGQDRRLHVVHPAGVPPGEHRLRAARLELHDRLRRPEDDRGVAADARQRPAREGLLDHDGHAAGPGRAPLRRERRPGHGRAREDLPRGRARDGTEQKIEELVRFVRDAGRIPVQRDSLYNELTGGDAVDASASGTPARLAA